MLKRFLTLLAALMLLATVALAEGPAITLEEEKLLVVPSYGDQWVAYYVARIKNTGTVAIQLKDGVFQLKDKEGNELISKDWVNVFPAALKPGEEAFVCQQEYLDSGISNETVASHVFDIKASTDVYKTVTLLPATAEIVLPKNPDYESRTVYATITNNTDRDLYDVTLVFVIKDTEGKLLYVDEVTAYSAGVVAGGELKIRTDLSSSLDTWLNTEEASIGSIEAFAYIEKY